MAKVSTRVEFDKKEIEDILIEAAKKSYAGEKGPGSAKVAWQLGDSKAEVASVEVSFHRAER